MVISFYNFVSFKLYNFIHSTWFCSIAILFLSGFVIINYSLIKNKSRFVFFIDFIIVLVIFLVNFSFIQRGAQINNLLDFGNKIIICIEKYYSSQNNYPRTINDIIEFDCSIYDKKYILNNYKYRYYDYNDLNEKSKINKNNNYFKNNIYRLEIRAEILGDEHYYYSPEYKKFILTDK